MKIKNKKEFVYMVSWLVMQAHEAMVYFKTYDAGLHCCYPIVRVCVDSLGVSFSANFIETRFKIYTAFDIKKARRVAAGLWKEFK